MARIRSIKPEFFTSESIAALPLSARLTFIGLWTYVDDNGVGIDNELLVTAAIWPLERDNLETLARTREDLATLSRDGLVSRYRDSRKSYLYVTSWDEHQKVDHPRKPRYPRPYEIPPTEAPASENGSVDQTLATDSRQTLESVAPDQGAGIRDQGSGNPPTPPGGGRRPGRQSYDYDSDPVFGHFWSVFPKKKGKPAAYASWQKALARGADPNVIIKAAERYRDDPSRDPERTKYPQGWLSDERYADEADAPPVGRRYFQLAVGQLMGAPADVLREVLLPKFSEFGPVRKTANGYDVCCPAHEDREPSLSIARGTTHPVVLDCKAGCDAVDILAKLGLTWETLCKPREGDDAARGEWTPYGDAIAVYDYVNESSDLLFQVLRTAGKQFPQRVPDRTRKSGYRWTLGDTRRVLYRLPKIIEAVKDGGIIYVVEGEKDVHALERAGFVATCNPGGAGKWRDEYSEVLREAVVVIIADKDKPGQAHARQVMASLKGVAAAVEISEAADDFKDVSDHLAAGRSLAELEVTCQEDEYKPDLAPDLYEFISIVDPPSDWVIPGLLERSDRLIWTGFEGQGKSVVIRQIAVCAAAGTHPFTREPITPQRVLFIDCENPDRKSRRHFRKLEAIARANGFPVPEGTLRILQRPAGIDLTREEDAAWLVERVTAHRPDLLVCGPFYRLHAKDTNEETAARIVVSALDAARIKADCALVTEAHAGHGGDGASRSVRPVGSSLLMRWPEFGYGIKPIGEADENGRARHVAVVPWRGPREERHWPRELIWGTHELDWPWVAADHLNLPPL